MGNILLFVILSACANTDRYGNDDYEVCTNEDSESVYNIDDAGLAFDSLEISGKVIEPGAADNINHNELILLDSFEKSNTALYYYASYKEIDNDYSYAVNNILFECDGIYSEYAIDIDEAVIDEFSYGEYDYDGDGELEIGAALILDHGTGYRDTRLYIFDILSDSNYQLYCLSMPDYAEAVEDAVLKLYKRECGINYEVTRRNQIGSGMAVGDEYGCAMDAENGNPIMFGDNSVMVKMLEQNTIKASVTIFEALPERQYGGSTVDYLENAWLEYQITYKGKGNFAFKDITLVYDN